MRNVVNTLVSFRQVLILYEIVVSSLPAQQTRARQYFWERERVEMRTYLILILIVALFVDIGLSKPLSRKKRQLNGTGVSGGISEIFQIWH